MPLHPALWYRAAMTVGLIGLTLFAWLVVGGQLGAIIWLVGFLTFWAATRFANRIFGGFLLGDDRAPEFGHWPHEDHVDGSDAADEHHVDAGRPDPR